MGSTASSPDKRRVLAIALIAAVPTFLLRAGELNADTKLYLTSDPGRLLSGATRAWDPSQFLGYVPHQAVGYLWPMGPFFWLGDVVGLPDWIMQRLWLSLIFAAAGTGVYLFLKRLGFRPDAALAGAIFFQVTPYVLSYQSRTSVMLLPWAATGWLALIAHRGSRRDGWRDPAIIALIVFSVGGINATALVMVAPVVLIVAFCNRESRLRQTTLRFLRRSAALSALCSMWWISMLAIQARYGAAVLSYSETLEAVSSTSTSFEVLRGMGYWLNYVVVGPDYGTTSAVKLMSSTPALIASCLLPLSGVIWLGLSRHRHVGQASVLVLVGLVASTGAYGMTRSSLVMRALSANSESSLALALRSSTRAIPVLLLGLAIAWGGTTEWTLTRLATRVRLPGLMAPVVTLAVLVVALPSLHSSGVVDTSLMRPAEPPLSWRQTDVLLDGSISPSARVVQVPGQEFGAYDWGFTVDPIWPAVSTRPLATRDLLPLGGEQSMDLLYAFDDAVQNGATTDIGVRSTARRLGAGAVLLPGDLDEERFKTTPPSEAIVENELSIDEEVSLGTGQHSIILDPSTSVATVASDLVQLAGSGAGIVTADSQNLIGRRLVLYTADQGDEELRQAADDNIPLIVTDTNRVQARHWRTSYDTVGYSEDGTDITRVLRDDIADRRLGVFPELNSSQMSAEQTVVRQRGDVVARATSYGTPLLYWPEHRPSAAIDGDLRTAWRTGAYANPSGEAITVSASSPFTEVRLVQPQSASEDRWITQISYSVDEGDFVELALTMDSRQSKGQVIRLPRAALSLTLRIDLVGWSVNGVQAGLDGVGFAEIDLGFSPTTEETNIPSRALKLSRADRPVAYTFSRLRARVSSTWRMDPEIDLRRIFLVPGDTSVRGELTGSLAFDADERLVAPWLGVTTFASGRFTRDFSTAGWNATDGNETTVWVGAQGVTRGASLSFQMESSSDGVITQPISEQYSLIRRAMLSDGKRTEIVDFDDATGTGHFKASSLRPGRWTLTVTETKTLFSVDQRSNVPASLPIAISDIRSDGLQWIVPSLPSTNTSTLPIALNGKEVRVSLKWRGLPQRPTFTAQIPETLLGRGSATFTSSSLHDAGVAIDEVAIVNHAWQEVSDTDSRPLTITTGSTTRQASFPGCATECWFVFAESYNRGWSARLGGSDLGEPRSINGGFNGWRIPAGTQPGVITLRFEPQLWLNIGLAVTASTVMCILILLVVNSRRRTSAMVGSVQQPSQMSPRTQSSTPTRTLIAIISGAVLVAAISQPVYGAPAAAIFSLAVFRRTHVAARIVTLVWLASSFVFGLLRILLSEPPIRFDWPTETAFVHWDLVVCIAIVAVLQNSTALIRPGVKSHDVTHN